MIDLRFGDWRTTMADVECDALITDPPYSQRTEDGFLTSATLDTPNQWDGIGYAPLDEAYCHAFVESWFTRVRHWFVIFGDHISNRWWLDALDAANLQTFAPVVWAKISAAPRFTGDGPASQCEYMAVARTRGSWATAAPTWGSLLGWYSGTVVRHGHGSLGVTGAKPEPLMRALVRDYSRPGWTIADPHAGSGTTLVAARAEGRHCIGSEMDPDTYAIAKRRIEMPYARDLFQREAV